MNRVSPIFLQQEKENEFDVTLTIVFSVDNSRTRDTVGRRKMKFISVYFSSIVLRKRRDRRIKTNTVSDAKNSVRHDIRQERLLLDLNKRCFLCFTRQKRHLSRIIREHCVTLFLLIGVVQMPDRLTFFVRKSSLLIEDFT